MELQIKVYQHSGRMCLDFDNLEQKMCLERRNLCGQAYFTNNTFLFIK